MLLFNSSLTNHLFFLLVTIHKSTPPLYCFWKRTCWQAAISKAERINTERCLSSSFVICHSRWDFSRKKIAKIKTSPQNGHIRGKKKEFGGEEEKKEWNIGNFFSFGKIELLFFFLIVEYLFHQGRVSILRRTFQGTPMIVLFLPSNTIFVLCKSV